MDSLLAALSCYGRRNYKSEKELRQSSTNKKGEINILFSVWKKTTNDRPLVTQREPNPKAPHLPLSKKSLTNEPCIQLCNTAALVALIKRNYLHRAAAVVVVIKRRASLFGLLFFSMANMSGDGQNLSSLQTENVIDVFFLDMSPHAVRLASRSAQSIWPLVQRVDRYFPTVFLSLLSDRERRKKEGKP